MKPTTLYKTAVIVHTLNSILMIVVAFPALMQGPLPDSPLAGIPQIVVVTVALMGVAGLVSAYGAWQGQKWGVWLTIVLEAANGILALPGVLGGHSTFARISATASVLIAIFVIVALLRRPKMATSAQVGSAHMNDVSSNETEFHN